MKFHIQNKDIAAGRLEVDYYGVRGNVCASNFNINDARVFCRHLGFEEAVNISPWTKEMNISFAISMKCSGSETSPVKCSNFTISQVVKCNNSDIIGLFVKGNLVSVEILDSK